MVRLSADRGAGAEPDIRPLRHLLLGRSDGLSRPSILGPRLMECSKLVLEVEGKTARQIFGPVDEMKFRSSMMAASPDEPLFSQCLEKYFGGKPDPATLEKLSR